MDFDKQLESAIQRGQNKLIRESESEQQKKLSEEEIKRTHSKFRLDLSEYIESGLKKLADHFPGFSFESVISDKGWGSAIYRDDLGPGANGRSDSFFSRLEILIRPLSKFAVVDIAAKGTIRNKELFNRQFYREIGEADQAQFEELIERWILEYAEMFASAK